MQEIHEEQNKDKTSITVFSFYLRLQYGSIWHRFYQWRGEETEQDRMLEARREGKVGERPDLLFSFHSLSDTVAGTFYPLSKWMEHIYPTHDDSF